MNPYFLYYVLGALVTLLVAPRYFGREPEDITMMCVLLGFALLWPFFVLQMCAYSIPFFLLKASKTEISFPKPKPKKSEIGVDKF